MDFYVYSELYHFGIEGMHWGVRRYQNPDGTRTEEGKRRRRSINPLDAMEKIFGKDNKIVNRILNSNGDIRKTYIQMQRSRTEKERRQLAKKAKRYAEEYVKVHDRLPMSYEQSLNAQRGAAIGTAVGIAVPIILPLWATIPAGYYIGSKVGGKKR